MVTLKLDISTCRGLLSACGKFLNSAFSSAILFLPLSIASVVSVIGDDTVLYVILPCGV